MDTIEQNDVDISKLFLWKGKLDVVDQNEEVIMSVHIRLAGDADTNRARTFAIRESAKFRNMLKSDSEDRVAYLMPPEILDSDSLTNLIKSLSMRDLSTAAVNAIRLDLPKQPDEDASLEELERYQELVDNYPEERFKLIQKRVERGLETIEKELEGLSKEQLYKKYEDLMISNLCENKMVENFKDYSIFLCSYRDSKYKNKLFSSFDEFDNLPLEIKSQFREFYMSLELGISDLKK